MYLKNTEFVQNTQTCHTLQKIKFKKFDISLSVTYKKCIIMKIGGKQPCLADPV